MKFYTIYIFLFLSWQSVAQQNYWVKTQDLDFFSKSYPSIKEISHSKWLDMSVFTLDRAQVDAISVDSNVLELIPVRMLESTNVNEGSKIDFGTYVFSLSQLGSDRLHKQGFNGSGVKIGIVDAGFANANTDVALTHVFQGEQIAGINDFRSFEDTNFYSKNFFGDYHGRKVFRRIAGVKDSEFLGAATNATFYLSISENNGHERQLEEFAWIEALEWFYSKGVRLVNSSLGYADRFDDDSENYKLSDMDGNTAIISRAAKIAVEEKGMIIVNSMGNEGNKDWEYVVAPADVEGVISVGATKKNSLKVDYSSIGIENGDFIKPDVVCYARKGTSFSAPYITGLIAQLLQYDNTLSNAEVKTILEQSSNLYPFKNNYVGYGIPNGERALSLIKGETLKYDTLTVSVKSELKLNLDFECEKLNLFHKKNKSDVIEQLHVDFGLKSKHDIKLKKGNKLYLRRPNKKVEYTTVDLYSKVIEVNWK